MKPPYRGRLSGALAVLLATLGTSVYVLDSDLAAFFVPLRWVVLVLLGGAVVLLAIHVLRHPRGSRPTWVLLLGGACLMVAGWVYVQEFTAYREIDLAFESGGETMQGTLYLPNAQGVFPAVVIGQGSIRAPRRLYHFWADRLVREGIAVYSFDKRGTGKSGGDYESENNSSVENLTRLGQDVAAALAAMRRHPEVAPDRSGILGLSMGGWMAPIAAVADTTTSFVILVSGPTVSVGEEGYFSRLTGELHEEAEAAVGTNMDSLLMATLPSGFDPRPLLREMTMPGLWLYGTADTSVPVAKSVVVLDSLIQQEGRPFDYRLYPGAEHLGFVMAWPYDLAPGLMDDLIGWIKELP